METKSGTDFFYKDFHFSAAAFKNRLGRYYFAPENKEFYGGLLHALQTLMKNKVGGEKAYAASNRKAVSSNCVKRFAEVSFSYKPDLTCVVSFEEQGKKLKIEFSDSFIAAVEETVQSLDLGDVNGEKPVKTTVGKKFTPRDVKLVLAPANWLE